MGKGKGTSALGELDPNVQPPMPVPSGRPRRQAAEKAGSAITGQYNLSPVLESPGSSPNPKSKVGRLAKSARDPSPIPALSRSTRRPKASASVPVPTVDDERPRRHAAKRAALEITEQYILNPVLESLSSSPPSKSKVGRLAKSARDSSPIPGPSRPSRRTKASTSVPVPPESESDLDFPSDEDAFSERLSDGELDDEASEGFDCEYLPCAENGDEECEKGDDLETDVEDQSDVESDIVDPSEDGDEEDAPMSAKAKGKRPARKAAPVPKVAGSRRPKKARKTASRKSPSSKVSAKEWLRAQNKASGIKPDDPDVKRFQQLMSEIVRRLSAKCRILATSKAARKEQSRVNAGLSWTTQAMLRKMEPTEICEAMFEHIPLLTQKILGKPNLEARDLQGLPKGATLLNLPGTYLDVLGRFRLEQIKREPHPDFKFIKIKDVRTLKPFVSEATALEIRLYLGSAVIILHNRLHTHILEMNRPDNDKKYPEAAHYREFGNRHDVVPDFRVTSVWEPEDDGRFTLLTEGLLMTYLGLQNSGKDSQHHPAATFELNLELRAGLDLPDFMGISLNRAWPLFQGFQSLSREKHTCENPAHPEGKDSTRMYYVPSKDGYRCNACYLHLMAYGLEWPSKSGGKTVKTLAPAAEKEQGCANPSHKEEWAHAAVKFNQRVGGLRCHSCAQWVKAHGRDYPFDQNGVDTTIVIKVCQNIGHEDHWTRAQPSFRESLNEFRCQRCFAWHKKEGRDYPYLANGQVRRWICESPGHPASSDPFVKISEKDGVLRCGNCSTYYHKHGVDKPATS